MPLNMTLGPRDKVIAGKFQKDPLADGRNRYLACVTATYPPSAAPIEQSVGFVRWEGGDLAMMANG
jgi:hypothetical protein